VNLEIIGHSDWNINYYKSILKLIEIENSKGKHKIKYLGPIDSNHPRLIEEYQKASVLILPSLYEAFGMVIIEALACETPVITTNVGGTPEIVKDGVNGILVPVNDPVKLAEAIDYLLNNKYIRRKFGEAGRKIVVENFSIEVLVKKLYKIYKKIINAQRS
jgi:glycosyltransferase involved in cell wall biosynthesis